QAGPRQGACRSHPGELLEPHVGDAPLADAGAADDPLVAGIENGGQVVVGEDRRWQALAPAGNRRVYHWGAGAHDGRPRIAGPALRYVQRRSRRALTAVWNPARNRTSRSTAARPADP